MKIGIVGSGLVGATTAYTLVQRGIGREVVLVNRTPERARAEAADVRHAVPFAHPLNVRAGDYAELADCHVVIITAGVPQQGMKSRMDLLEGNAALMREIVPQILAHAPQAVLLIATNPVDVMTHLAAQVAAEYGVPPCRVLGSGTLLDTARFCSIIADRIGVDAQYINGYVIGEHGDSEVMAWSLVTVGAVPLDAFCFHSAMSIEPDERIEIGEQVRKAGFEIFQGKGATYYGVSSALARIAEVIIKDERAVLTVSTPLSQVEGIPNVSLSLPCLVGGNGVIQNLPIALSPDEHAALRASAEVIRDAAQRIGIA